MQAVAANSLQAQHISAVLPFLHLLLSRAFTEEHGDKETMISPC